MRNCDFMTSIEKNASMALATYASSFPGIIYYAKSRRKKYSLIYSRRPWILKIRIWFNRGSNWIILALRKCYIVTYYFFKNLIYTAICQITGCNGEKNNYISNIILGRKLGGQYFVIFAIWWLKTISFINIFLKK